MSRLTLIGWIVLAVSVQAQHAPPRTRTLDITLTEGDCEKLKDVIWVMFGGDDRDPVPAYRVKDEPCHYRAEKNTGEAFTLDKHTKFSLRLGGARTDCRVPSEIPGKTPPYMPIATLMFPFKLNSARGVTIAVDSRKFILTYVRNYLGCREGGTIPDEVEVRDVVSSVERVELFLGTVQYVIDRTTHDELDANAKKGKPVTLTPRRIGTGYSDQIAKRVHADNPSYASSNAGDIATDLVKVRLNKMTLKRK